MVYMWLSGSLSVGSVFTPTFRQILCILLRTTKPNNEKMAKLTMQLPGKLVEAALKHNNSGENKRWLN
jgi:hypothetical protein